MEMPFFKKTFQLVLKIFNSELVGNLGIMLMCGKVIKRFR